MEQYKLQFSNTRPFYLTASSREDAIERGVSITRGILSEKQQRRRLKSCKLFKPNPLLANN